MRFLTKKTNFPVLKYMDGEYLFKYYFQAMGASRSLIKLIEHCRTEYMIHPEQGRPPTKMGIYKAMWRWATVKENQKMAWEIYKTADLGEEWNPINEWGAWVDFLKERVPSAYQYDPKTYKRFLVRNGYSV